MTTPPIKLKRSPNSAPAAAVVQDARLLVRETMRISANLATSSAPIGEAAVVVDDARSFGLVERPQFVESSLRLICAEEIDGRRWNYVAEKDGAGKFKRNSFRAVSLQSPQAPAEVTSLLLLCMIILLADIDSRINTDWYCAFQLGG